MNEQRAVTEVFYDGSCGLCTRSVAPYRSYAERGFLRFTDISDPRFRGADGRPPEQFYAALHARCPDGRWVSGADAVAEIWRELPDRPMLRTAARIMALPGVRQIAQKVYRLVARNRATALGDGCDGNNGSGASHSSCGMHTSNEIEAKEGGE